MEIVTQSVLCGTTAMLVVRFGTDDAVGQRALPVLALAAGVATSILLTVAAWMSADRAARRIAAAVGLYTVLLLLTRAVGIHDSATASSAWGGAGALGTAGLLAAAAGVKGRFARSRASPPAVAAVVATGLLTVAAIGIGNGLHRSSDIAAAVDLLAWSAMGVTALLLLAVGVRSDRSLLRRAGLAFTVSAIGHALSPGGTGVVDVSAPRIAGALELAGAAVLLVGAVLFLASTLRGVLDRQEVTESRLAEAEAAVAETAERDHEMRNLVAGLSGAANVLRSDEVDGTVEGRRLLVAAGAELERLQQMLRPGSDSLPGLPTSVAPLLTDLAAVHRAGGLTLHLEVEGDPEVGMDRASLAQVLTNLLVNCARHAPGAPVWLRCRSHGDTVRIEVVDDGPGLPADTVAAVLRRGVRGPGSTGDGLGLAINADLATRHGGTFTLLSGGRGCTARLDLPSASDLSLHWVDV